MQCAGRTVAVVVTKIIVIDTVLSKLQLKGSYCNYSDFNYNKPCTDGHCYIHCETFFLGLQAKYIPKYECTENFGN